MICIYQLVHFIIKYLFTLKGVIHILRDCIQTTKTSEGEGGQNGQNYVYVICTQPPSGQIFGNFVPPLPLVVKPGHLANPPTPLVHVTTWTLSLRVPSPFPWVQSWSFREPLLHTTWSMVNPKSFLQNLIQFLKSTSIHSNRDFCT